MKLLLDTHILLWLSGDIPCLSKKARALLEDPANDLMFSVVSIWEITIKHGLGRDDFEAEPHLLRRGLIDNGYLEVPVTGDHALAVGMLPSIHKDPFDRLLIAQALVEGATLITADKIIARYPTAVKKV